MSDMKKNKLADMEVRVRPSRYAYIRSGDYADKNWRSINAELKIDTNCAVPLAIKKGSESFERKIFLGFELDEFRSLAYKKVFLIPTWSIMQAGHRIHIYDLGDDRFDPDAITWNHAPVLSGEPIVRDKRADHLVTYDLTEAVTGALEAGRNHLDICLDPVATTNSQAHMTPTTTVLVATSADSITAFTTNLLPDKAANQAIWDHAEQAVKEWLSRYEALKMRDYEPKRLPEEDRHFDKIVYTSGTGFGNHTMESVGIPQKTRTYGAMDDLGKYTDYKQYPQDVYGGCMDPDMKQEATGFFRTAKINGRRYIIDPLGYPCLLRTVKGLQTYQVRSKRQYEIAMEKFGNSESFFRETVGYFKHELGFNAATGPSDLLKVEDGVIAERSNGFARAYGKRMGLDNSTAGSSTFSQNNTMPVFDPEFTAFCDIKAREDMEFVDNPWVLGYTTDNELPMDKNMLTNYLSLSPDTMVNGRYVNHYSYAAAWTWFKVMTGKEKPAIEDIDDEMMDLFRGFVWDRYFSIVTPAMKKYHPNHMILGTRFLTHVTEALWVLRFASQYIDVLTVNWYGQWTPRAEDLYNLAKNTDLPIYITEFYVKALENDGCYNHPDVPLTNKNGAGWVVRTQQDRGDFYQNFVLRLLECPDVVGWQWIGYQDNDDSPEAIYLNGVDASGGTIGTDGFDVNRGIMNNWHEPYEELCNSMTEINFNVYRLAKHFDAKNQ